MGIELRVGFSHADREKVDDKIMDGKSERFLLGWRQVRIDRSTFQNNPR
ncbi:hypothetical protein NX722_18120 [Endozoicomonas gorgoniicola]|uniref:Uncharacterized protein n=1 Tax=Endozoicomonas gorgoniicola TaxID=1234144 RepID=A0ABT3MUP8_9GAMM|nr:hypothetical protein [Endozoicomonas gorgoniicola]MCW7552808.1 hypothetical protein [Endozoicomonas gorgoniicola]MCW7554503.1 hypothetical protein [Endozoicomonas gorgoniicola]